MKARDTITKHTPSVHSYNDANKLMSGKNGMIKAKDIEKKFLIQMKEMEKMVKDCKIECTEHLSKNQLMETREIVEMQGAFIKVITNKLDTEIKQNNSDVSKKLEYLLSRDKEIIGFQDDVIKIHFKKMHKEFNDSQDMLEQCIKKMQKDKRDFNEKVIMNTMGLKSFEKRVDMVHVFFEQVFKAINILQEAVKIETVMAEQDELDRDQTVLYGLNEEMASKDYERKSPIILNNQCANCGGNPKFIKKAFKMACLSYNSSSVNYNN